MTYKSFTNSTVKTVKLDSVPCLCLCWTSGIAAGSELRLNSLFDFFYTVFKQTTKLLYKEFPGFQNILSFIFLLCLCL